MTNTSFLPRVCSRQKAAFAATFRSCSSSRRILRVLALVPLSTALTVALLSTSAPVVAQTAATGSATGRVQNMDSGSYLSNARVRVQGTSIETFTNQSGEYRLTGVPAGQATLEVFYTGMPVTLQSITVPAAGTVQQDFSLRRERSSTEPTPEGETLTLSPFVVASQREYNAQAIALNEQRFAANKREVVSTDALGQINQGNIGEFVKHLPGITFEVKDGNNPSGIMVRGFNSNYTNVTLDGNQLASAALSNTQTHTRQFVLEQANINNLARIEVVKLPTPDMAANLLGGAVNLVSKSAFERPAPEFSFATYLSANSSALDFEKTPGPGPGKEFKIRPSLELNYAHPVSKTFGFVVSAAHSSQYYENSQTVPQRRYNGSGATFGQTPPQTNAIGTTYAPNLVERTSGAVKLDWKPFTNHLLEFAAQANAFEQMQASRSANFNVQGATLAPGTWGETFVHGAFNAPTAGTPIPNMASLGNSFQQRHGLTRALSLRWSYEGDDWKAELAGAFSHSNSNARDAAKGFWRGMGTVLRDGRRVDFDGIDNTDGSVDSVKVYDTAGNVIDTTKLSNYNLTTVNSEPQSAEDTVKQVRGSVTRGFTLFSVPFSIKAGGDIIETEREIDYANYEYTYAGPDGILATGDEGLGAFIDQDEIGRSPGFGRQGQEWASPWAVYQAFKDHPTWFTRTPVQEGNTWRNWATRSPLVTETITSGYIMGDAKFFRNRLRVVGGVRYEFTENEGYGVKQDNAAQFQRDASGNLIKNAAGQFIRRTDIGVAQSLQEAMLTHKYRGQFNSRDYDGYYPSIHTTTNILENLLLRVAYAETIGRPRIVDIVPTLNITDDQTFGNPGSSAQYPGTITASNTTLVPWSGKNYDYSLEYYLPKNGVISFSAFRKDIRDFFGTVSTVVDAALAENLGLESRYVGYRYTTRVNVGDARITGWEANLVLPLSTFGSWGQPFTLRGNITHLDLKGSRIGPGDFGNYIPRAHNVGVLFNFGRLSGNVLMNYKGRMLRDTAGQFPGALEYIRERYQFDAGLEYRISKRFALFFAGRNLTDESLEWEVDGPGSTSWATLTNYQVFGAQYSLGVKGSF